MQENGWRIGHSRDRGGGQDRSPSPTGPPGSAPGRWGSGISTPRRESMNARRAGVDTRYSLTPPPCLELARLHEVAQPPDAVAGEPGHGLERVEPFDTI